MTDLAGDDPSSLSESKDPTFTGGRRQDVAASLLATVSKERSALSALRPCARGSPRTATVDPVVQGTPD